MASPALGAQLELGEKEESRNKRSLIGHRIQLAWFLVTPVCLVLLLIVGYPLAQAFVLTFQKAKLDGSIPSIFVGIDNYVRLFGDPQFLGSMWAIVAVDVWRSSPYVAMILLAGLQLVPRELYDAATIDGATTWKRFWHITLPILAPTLLVALILRTVDAFRMFDLVAVMTEGDADTATAAFYNKQVLIDFNNAGLGSTISVVILLISLSFVFLYSRLLKRSFE
jgi:ABC-type sugar transport system permease subunit